MRNIKLTLQYDGTEYSGWQVQSNGDTVQGLLEDALAEITGGPIRVTGAGRTDAGVHALEQVAAFSTESDHAPGVFRRALNAKLPDDIRVIDSEEAPEDFHPRYSARNKTYSYLISHPGTYAVFMKRYSWCTSYALNCDAMKQGAEYLTGKHDFSSFRASGCSSKHPVRDIIDLHIRKLDAVDFMGFRFNMQLIKISITANAFLRHMARNVVGTLVEIGRGKIPPEQMKTILEAKDRRVAGKTAPACGLFLERIEY
jgi:tRNA pseudouridine38-40 synthase